MERKIYALGAAIVAFALLVRATQNSNGAPNGNTGAPGETNCTACHGGSAVNSDPDGKTTVAVTLNGDTVTQYVLNQTYDVSVTVSHPQSNKFGFQLTALNSAGNSDVGTVTFGSEVSLNEDTGRNRFYLNHKSNSTSGTNNARTWTFRWRPEGVSGAVTFYAAGNATNGNGSISGDRIYTTSLTVQQNTTSRPKFLSENDFRVTTGRENRAEIRLSEATKGILTLADATGRTIWTRKVELPAGHSAHVLETDASGVYILTLSTDKGTAYRKFSVF
jgi:hypothetical protein